MHVCAVRRWPSCVCRCCQAGSLTVEIIWDETIFFSSSKKETSWTVAIFSVCVCVCAWPVAPTGRRKARPFPARPDKYARPQNCTGERRREREKKNKNKSFPNGPLEGFLESFQEFLADCFPAFSKGCFWKTIHALALLNFSSSSSNVSSSSGMVEGARKRESKRLSRHQLRFL